MVMKIIKGREKCMNYLKSEFVESKKKNEPQLEQISELLCHLRILTINTIEYYGKWKQQLN